MREVFKMANRDAVVIESKQIQVIIIKKNDYEISDEESVRSAITILEECS